MPALQGGAPGPREAFGCSPAVCPPERLSGPFLGQSGPILLHLTATGEEQQLPRKGPFSGPIGTFRANPPFAEPPFGCPQIRLLVQRREKAVTVTVSILKRNSRWDICAQITFP